MKSKVNKMEVERQAANLVKLVLAVMALTLVVFLVFGNNVINLM